jgi:hypothetical protein
MQKFGFLLLLVLLMLSGCGDGASEPGPGGVSAEDARALDEAAAKLDDEASAQSPPDSSN